MKVYGNCTRRATTGSNRFQKVPGVTDWMAQYGLGGPDACIDSYLGTQYFTQKSVMINTHVINQSFEWCTCCNQIQYTSVRENLPRDTYPALIENYRVLIYNGDWDACVPYTDNEAWTSNMGYELEHPWHPWLYLNDTQVAGYATRYAKNNFTFITIRGGRHEVPETAPRKAFEMIKRFVTNEIF